MLEVKSTDGQPVIAYSWISKNERDALTEFEGLIGNGHAFIVGLWLKDEKRAFLIPWFAVKDSVCSGVRGSINMLDFSELPKLKGAWDLKMMWEVIK